MKAKPDILQSVKDEIVAARAAKGLRNDDIARMAKVDKSQVSRIMQGEFKTFNQSVAQVCAVLQVQIPLGQVRRRQTDLFFKWPQLERSINRIWDGTPEGIDRIVRILESIEILHKGLDASQEKKAGR